MARKGLSITPAGNGCTPFGTKSSRNEDQQSYTEGKACFLHFTHNPTPCLRAAAPIAESLLALPCPENVARRSLGTFCAEMISAPILLKTRSRVEDLCFQIGPLGVR